MKHCPQASGTRPLRITRRGMRRDVPIPFLQADEISGLHLDGRGGGDPEDKQHNHTHRG